MNNGGWVVGVLWGVGCVAGCGQELELPITPAASDESTMAGRSSGFTGYAGDAGDVPQAGRLPLPNEPPAGPFGGAGGDGSAGVAGDAGRVDPGEGRSGASAGGRGGSAASNDGGQGGAEGGGGSLPATPPRLWFSEYVEGSGSSKALEIYALEAASLEGCELETYFNGKVEPGRLALHGELGAGQTHVLCSSTLAAAQPKLCSRSTNLTFNGDDALALRCSGSLLDVIGQIGVDPGAAWGNGATVDHTLRRRCDLSGGRSDGSTPFDPSAEWISFGPDTFSNLGQHACAE